MDLDSDQLANGRRVRILNIVDDYSPGIVLQIVDFSIPGYCLARELDQLERNFQKTIVCDNGPEFTCKAMFFRAKKPEQNYTSFSQANRLKMLSLNRSMEISANTAWIFTGSPN